MKKIHLHFEFRIKATSILKGRVETAMVSYIKQKGEQKEGWGLAKERGHKIYILRFREEIIYVGITKQPLNSRFRQGLTATGRNGFYGYAWKSLAVKGKSKIIDLFVYKFGDEKLNDDEIRDATEATEAEIVFLVRSERKQWPKYQTEIHFHQANSEEVLAAKQIYDQVSNSR